MNAPSILDYQRQLIAASLDDFTPNAVFANFHGGQYGSDPDQWRYAVIDFLCESLRCGLIEVTHRPDISEKRDAKSLRNLLTHGDEERGMDENILWNVLYFNGTSELVDIINKCGMHSWESLSAGENKELAEILRGIYFVSQQR